MALWTEASWGEVYISEFLADNETGIQDEEGSRQDWLELYNTGDAAVNLDGWWLTDTITNPMQWRIPNVSIPAKGFLFIWASGEDRRQLDAPLHTSFSLSKGGEYLGLYRPNPTNGQPVLVDHYTPGYPSLPPDISYGRSFVQPMTNFVVSGDVGRYRVLSAAEGDAVYFGTNYAAGQLGHGAPGGWNVNPGYDDGSWGVGATGIGYDTTGGFAPWIGTTPSGDCLTAFRYTNTSLCFRKTFVVQSPEQFLSYTLRMKYEDGFVAFINGTEVGRRNCTSATNYNAKADVALDEAMVNTWTEFGISNALVTAGTNVLAVQGLNVATTSSDFLLLPEVDGTGVISPGAPGYFSEPTPASLNGQATGGPLLFGATPGDPDVPRPLGNASSPAMMVTVRVIRTKSPIASVSVYTRRMWDAESGPMSMRDDGVAPDVAVADGVYTATLPTAAIGTGEMFRWRFEARDTLGVSTKLPSYASAIDSPQYFGTVAADASTASSQLPVLLWFVQGSPTNGPIAAAFRGSCYYLNQFYDNIGHEIHGQSTSGFIKKSYDFDFNSNHRFLWRGDQRRVKDVNLLTNYADKTKTRNTFSHWVGMMTGTPYHFAYPVRVHLNGVFHGVMDMVEDGDDRMLDRNGLDPAGALYKIYATDLLTNVEKKSRKEEGNDDLIAFAAAINATNALSSRQVYAYDNIDIPASINYLVTRALNSDRDHGHKNYYLYRDSDGTREWQPIIWDVDLSQGHIWNSVENYFDDDLITNAAPAQSGSGLYAVILESTEMRQMWVRRMRTLMDAFMQPPGTTNGIFETRMREIVAAVDPDPANPSSWTDGDIDAARWGIDARFSQNRPREEVERVICDYFGPRRSFLFNTGTGRPLYQDVAFPSAPQVNAPGMVTIDSLDFFPASGTQAHEYVIVRNMTTQAVDVSGWQLEGEIDHVFKGGTVIPAGDGTAGSFYRGLLHIVKDALAFRSRPSGPTGGQRRLVQGNYVGQLSARGGYVNLRDDRGVLIDMHFYAGSALPTQRCLRITEIQYHPTDPTAEEEAAIPGVTDDDFEYLELMNTGTADLALTGAYFSQGIDFTFPDVPEATLGAGQRLIIAKDRVAFALRYPSVSVPVFGPYEGQLDNSGDRIELTDASGENILDFEYKDGWYPHSDGSGRSLVLRDTSTAHDSFGNAVTWALSGEAMGSPGTNDTHWAQAYRGWDNFRFSEADRENALVSGPNADPDGDGRCNWVEYALGSDPWLSDVDGVAFAWAEIAGDRYAGLRFSRPAHALDVAYELLASDDMGAGTWSVREAIEHGRAPIPGDRETSILRESVPAEMPRQFLKLRMTFWE